MLRRARSLAILATCLLVPVVTADDWGDCEVGTGAGFHRVDAPTSTYYLDDRGYSPYTITVGGVVVREGSGVWIYEESNDIPGLQRGGNAALTGDAETCETRDVTPDRLLF